MEQRMPLGQNQAFSNSGARYQDSQSLGSETAPREEVAASQEADKVALQRAEELVDHLGERIDHYLSLLVRELSKAAARAREEVQDIWAEAEHISGRGRS
jgi:hypothetical protein